MSADDDRPWLGRYGEQPAEVQLEHDNALDMFRAGLSADPTGDAIRYFDGALTRSELDEQSDALASALLAHGFAAGDRLAVYLQNVPQFLVCMVATWKAGGVMVSINPMSRARELSCLLEDSGAKVLVALEALYDEVARVVVPDTDVQLVLTTSELEHQTRHDDRLFTGMTRQRHERTTDLAELIRQHRGQVPPPVSLGLDDVAFLTYTSGTTGVPKGAMNTHRNVVFTAQLYRDWAGFRAGGSVLGIAPLFHITGLIGHVAVSLLSPLPLVLTYRFEPQVVLDAMLEHRPTCTIGAITALNALLASPAFTKDHFSSFTSVYSGGAAISPAAERRFLDRTGKQVHNAYGLTETTSPMTLTPFGSPSPVDPNSGALSVGVPVPSTVVRIQDEDGADLPLGEVGEIVADGPQVVAGYWGKLEQTAADLPGGALRSGDVGFMNADGWVFIVDRKKDMINASGYKVWPREVEDVLAEHPAVREAAVVGVPDDRRGETVKAFVSLQVGATVTPDELVAHCKQRMAAYKYPRLVVLLDELPKTVTGKILRRELRDQVDGGSDGGSDGASPPAQDPPGLALAALDEHLRSQLPRLLHGPLSAQLLAGGRSNLTYLLTDGHQRWVLRRPPLGHVLETAHDMAREHRVLTALSPTDVPVPEPLLLVGPEVLGAPCYVMEFAAGQVLRDRPQLDRLDTTAATALADELVDVLVRLHRLDPAAVGLGDLGRPHGYLERQLRRWAGQLAAPHSRDLPELARLAERLAVAVPASQRAAIVHGDYRLDNVVVDPAHGRVVAVLDWEMATLGDPLADVASTVVWWDGMAGLASPVAAVPADVPGFPPSGRLLAGYARQSGLDLDPLPWYLGFAFLKIAVIFEGIAFRSRQGLTVGAGFERIGALAPPLVQRGHAALDQAPRTRPVTASGPSAVLPQGGAS